MFEAFVWLYAAGVEPFRQPANGEYQSHGGRARVALNARNVRVNDNVVLSGYNLNDSFIFFGNGWCITNILFEQYETHGYLNHHRSEGPWTFRTSSLLEGPQILGGPTESVEFEVDLQIFDP